MVVDSNYYIQYSAYKQLSKECGWKARGKKRAEELKEAKRDTGRERERNWS